CLAQNEKEAARLSALGAQNVHVCGNLKYASQPLPHNDAALAGLRGMVANRPCPLFAATHPGEEDIALRVHRAVVQTAPDLLTIILPRHPARGDAIAQTIRAQGMNMAQRSKEEAIK